MTFSDKTNLKEFVASKLLLKECLKKIFSNRQKGNDKEKSWCIERKTKEIAEI